MGDNSYAFAVARIRVKEKKLLSDADIAQMAAMKDEASVLAFLADRGWGDSQAAADAEEMLSTEEAKNLALMKELKIDPAIFEVLEYPKLFHNLKAGIKEVLTEGSHEKIFYDIEGLGREEMMQIIREKEYASLPEFMRAAAEEAYEVMVNTRDGQRCDTIVDRGCLEAMLSKSRRMKNAMMKSYVSSQVAVADIKIAVRAAKTGKSYAFLKEALAQCDTLNADGLAQAASRGEEALYAYLQESGYAEAADAIRESPSAFERWCDNRLIETIRPQRMNSVSASPIVAYYLARENEIRMARIILTAKANGFDEDSIRERVRKMYV